MHRVIWISVEQVMVNVGSWQAGVSVAKVVWLNLLVQEKLSHETKKRCDDVMKWRFGER